MGISQTGEELSSDTTRRNMGGIRSGWTRWGLRGNNGANGTPRCATHSHFRKDEAPPPEFRKQGHHMLEIIAAQIKEMEDAGWIFRGKSSTACPLHVVRKPTEPGKPQKWRITCDYRELNNYIISVGDNHASWDPIGSWEFKILQHRGTQVGVGNVGVYCQKRHRGRPSWGTKTLPVGRDQLLKNGPACL